MAELEEPVDGPQAAESLPHHLFISTDITFYFILILIIILSMSLHLLDLCQAD